jgi:hypothetical protein
MVVYLVAISERKADRAKALPAPEAPKTNLVGRLAGGAAVVEGAGVAAGAGVVAGGFEAVGEGVGAAQANEVNTIATRIITARTGNTFLISTSS